MPPPYNPPPLVNRRNDEPSVVDGDLPVPDVNDTDNDRADDSVHGRADDSVHGRADEQVIDLRERPDDEQHGHPTSTAADTGFLVDRRGPRPVQNEPRLGIAMEVSTVLNGGSLCSLQRVAVGLATAFEGDQAVDLTLLDGRSGQLRPISSRQQEVLLGRLEGSSSATAQRLERRLAKTGLRSRRWEPTPDTWFIDVEPAWQGPVPRSELLPRLEAAGVRISAFVPDLLRLHHPDWYTDSEVTGFRQWLRAHRTAASTWLAASLATADDLVYWLGPRSKNHEVKLLTLGVPDDIVAGDTLRQPPEDGRLLLLGPVAVHSGHRLLLDALDEFRRAAEPASLNRPPVVDVVGDLGHDTQLIDDLRKDISVRVHDQLSETALQRLWVETSFLVSPRLGDGTGATLVEALARGIPVVATDLPAAAEASQGLATVLKPDPTAWAHFLTNRFEHHSVAAQRTTQFKPTTWTETAAELRRFLHGLDRPSSGLGLTTTTSSR